MPDPRTPDTEKNHHELLVRLDERSYSMTQDLASLKEDVRQIKEDRQQHVPREEFERRIASLVSKTAFWPVKTIVYIGAGSVLLGVLGALMTLVIKGGGVGVHP